MCSASKREPSPYGSYIRTNTGLEPFDDLVDNFDLDVWNNTSVELQRICSTRKIGSEGRHKDEHHDLQYEAREIKLRERMTDRVPQGIHNMYGCRMSQPFSSIMSIDPMPAWYDPFWMASSSIVYLPSVDDIDWDHPAETNRRRQAEITLAHALENMTMNRSECSWEFDAWRDVFFKIRDDLLLAMDKHEAVFLEDKSLDQGLRKKPTVPFGIHTVRAHRIPDCTFGLSVKNITPETEGEDLLNNRFLQDILWHPEAGLISDPKWLAFDLVFPWAIYEAKKTNADPVISQIRRSSEIYLNILQDLCLMPSHPDSVRPYYTDDRNSFQVFSMTSEGPKWKLYVCYRRKIPEFPLWLPDPANVHQYDMKQIWEGDITKENEAWQLHSLVDQIHEWAIHTFRPFILNHLRAWHLYLKAAQDSSPSVPRSLNSNKEKNAARLRLKTRMESFKGTEEDTLDLLDEEISQQEPSGDFIDPTGTPEATPWWARYAKPEAMRQRILSGRSQHPVTPKKRVKISNENRQWRSRKKKSNALHHEYEAEQSRQDAEKVQSPSSSKGKRKREEN